MIKSTLCYIETEKKYLMLYRNKKKNDPNGGKWIGVGGKLEQGETPKECALREIKEETGLQFTDLTERGVVYFESDEWESETMYLFTAAGDERTVLTDCDEGELRWIEKSAIMDLPLWEGDRIFLKDLLEGKPTVELFLRYVGNSLVEVKTIAQS